MKKAVNVAIAILFASIVAQAQITVELQNGLNEYSGCQDLYIGNDKLSEVYPDANDNTSWMLVVGRFVC